MFSKYPFIKDSFPSKEEILIISDYREKASRNDYWGVSFIITDIDSIQPFIHYSKQIKDKSNIIGQQIKYNKIKAYKRRPEYVNEFLNAADEINGIMFTYIVHPSYKSFFNYSGKINQQDYPIFRPNQFQKLELFTHLVGSILSKFVVNVNAIKWITDHDNLINSSTRMKKTMEYFRSTIENYIGSNKFKLHFFDPDRDNEDILLKDLSNIPDLIVGPLTDIYNQYKKSKIEVTKDGVEFHEGIKFKAVSYSEWFFANHKNLKKKNNTIQFDSESNQNIFYDLYPKK